jgi:hypothetical protein
MDDNKKKKKFQIVETKSIPSQEKYKLGEVGMSFYDIKNFRPVFAFDYLSLNGNDYCFNNEGLSKEDYIGLLSGLRKISNTSYGVMHDNKAYRFHKIDFDDKSVTIKRQDFKNILTNKPELLDDEELPNLWQFDLHYVQEARVCGFLYQGVFYLVWYDRDHKIYPGTQ